ncbi:MAG: pyrroline-5-carboxylate reductase [Actinomycetia bacterium]|nr:pyrroline-5-carboxylate reductase [Actinomycetes bacterium]MCP4958620.1 pyrroline-5-carboxylate reductase [Actinomycetes bacterium]
MVELLIVGGGKMGEALLGGLLAVQPEGIAVVELVAERRAELEGTYGVSTFEAPVRAEAAIVAVKPQYVASVCRELAEVGVSRVLSIAAGVTLATLEDALGPGIAAIRAMPNTPALVGKGASALAGGTAATPDDVEWAVGILGSVGAVVTVDEAALDAVTGLSGSGPAYIFLVAEAMVEAGVLNGLPRDLATVLAFNTIAGAGEMLLFEGADAATLRANVTSPGGTTAAGLAALEGHGVRSAFLEAVSRAAERSRDLGGR